MINLKINKKAAITLKIIAFVSLLYLIVLFVMYFSGWIPDYPQINKNNIDNYLGDDLWKNVIEKFDDVEIDILPLKSQAKSITNYNAVLKIKHKDKSKWLNISKDVSSYINDYLISNPKCEINNYVTITVKIKYDTDANSVAFSNNYDFGENEEKLDGLYCISISSDNAFISFEDITMYDNAKYMIVNVKIDENTDFSALSKLNYIKELNLFVEEKFKTYAENQIETLNLSYAVHIK